MASDFKILIASPRFLMAQGFASVFERLGIDAITHTDSQDGLERCLMKELPDFILLDSFLGVFKAEKTIAFCTFTKPAKLVYMSDTIQREQSLTLKKVGIKSFISSHLQEVEILELIKALKNGTDFVDTASQKRFDFSEKDAFRSTCEVLNISEREVEIIKLIAEGFINKEIADKLFLSTHTVNTHRKNIMNKLGVTNATGIVIFAVKEKLISPTNFLFSSKA